MNLKNAFLNILFDEAASRFSAMLVDYGRRFRFYFDANDQEKLKAKCKEFVVEVFKNVKKR